eukprot:1515457-Prymnesium_polylepis.1
MASTSTPFRALSVAFPVHEMITSLPESAARSLGMAVVPSIRFGPKCSSMTIKSATGGAQGFTGVASYACKSHGLRRRYRIAPRQ